MTHEDRQHFTIQVGETAKIWRFRLTSQGEPYAIPAGATFTISMILVDADDDTELKIDAQTCDFTPLDDSVYYQPSDDDVDTAGRYYAQINGTTPGGLAMRPREFKVTIRENPVGDAA